MKFILRLIVSAVAGAALIAAGSAFAQAYPTKALRLIVPFAA